MPGPCTVTLLATICSLWAADFLPARFASIGNKFGQICLAPEQHSVVNDDAFKKELVMSIAKRLRPTPEGHEDAKKFVTEKLPRSLSSRIDRASLARFFSTPHVTTSLLQNPKLIL